MRSKLSQSKNRSHGKTTAAALALSVTLGSIVLTAPAARAQESTTLRNPLIPGAYYAAPMQLAPQGAPPPIGDGDTPLPVTPGMTGCSPAPATDVETPQSSPLDESGVQGAVAPYISPPASTPGQDPGMLPGTLSGYMPPALIAPVGPQGQLTGTPPIHHWGAQNTQDFGIVRTKGSQTCDFGQPLQNVAAVQPSYSEDGTHGLASNGAPAQPPLQGAQQTQQLYGLRTMSTSNQWPVQIIAPY